MQLCQVFKVDSSKLKSFSCLIVDDDFGFAAMLSKVAGEEGGLTTHCGDLKSALTEIEKRTFDLIILDNRLPDGTGYDFYPKISRQSPASIVVMITGQPELANALEMTRNGLFDYLTKPLEMADFVACLRRVKQRFVHPDAANASHELLGDSPAMREVLSSLKQIARHAGITVLLQGETGTGKDLAARTLHALSHAGQSQTAPYVPLNCSAIPAEMFESELFGSEKGAYTGADKRRAGLIEAAEGGTLFLDEITETPLPQQAKLLRFLESQEYRPLGANALRKFSGRIIAATNRVMEEEVRQGRFREDLMYRLNVATVKLPPLRERTADLDMLMEGLLSQISAKYGRKKPAIKPADAVALRNYHFPGNVRELRNLIERGLLRTPEDASWLELDPAWLGAAPAQAVGLSATASIESGRELSAIDEQEYRLIQEALRADGGAIRRAAARLGISHQALLRRLEKWPELRKAGEGAP